MKNLLRGWNKDDMARTFRTIRVYVVWNCLSIPSALPMIGTGRFAPFGIFLRERPRAALGRSHPESQTLEFLSGHRERLEGLVGIAEGIFDGHHGEIFRPWSGVPFIVRYIVFPCPAEREPLRELTLPTFRVYMSVRRWTPLPSGWGESSKAFDSIFMTVVCKPCPRIEQRV